MQLHLKENDCLDNSINTQILDIVDNLKPYVNKAHVEIKIILFFIFLLQTMLAKRFQTYINFSQCLKNIFVKNILESEIVQSQTKISHVLQQ